VVLNPTGQVAYMQRVRTGSNQSVDTVLLRYFAFDSEFHVFFFPEFRHLDFSQRSVIRVAHVIRLVIVLITVAAVWRWRRRDAAPTGHDVLTMAAVWSCTLYLMLPETKARYAVYTFLGFIPLIERAIDEDGRSSGRGYRIAEIVLCAMLIVGIVPEPVKTYGLGLAGAVGLWLANLRLMTGAAEWRAMARRILPAAAPWLRPRKPLRSSSES